MKKLTFGAVAAALALSTIAAVRFGGWAVVSVRNAPDYLVVGRLATFDFVVRQHGVENLRGLEPSVSARSGIKRVSGTVQPTDGNAYRASLTVPSAGDWNIVIESGFGRSRGRLLPKRAIAAGAAAPAITDVERGRQLFAAAGCVSCHVHRAVDMGLDMEGTGAPDLTDRRFPAEYLAKYLEDPSIKPRTAAMQMPNLGLRKKDIATLVAFINAEKKVAGR